MNVWWALKTVLSSCISQTEHTTAEVEDGALEQIETTGSAFMASSSYQNVFAKVRQAILDAPHRSLNESTLGSALAAQQVAYLLDGTFAHWGPFDPSTACPKLFEEDPYGENIISVSGYDAISSTIAVELRSLAASDVHQAQEMLDKEGMHHWIFIDKSAQDTPSVRLSLKRVFGVVSCILISGLQLLW